jgi:DNA adenine methylase
LRIEERVAEPFLKWAGGKRLLIDEIARVVAFDHHARRYYEPFLGGGALFFAVMPPRAVLSDINSSLIDAFVAVRDSPEAVIQTLELLRHTRRDYYAVRSWRPRRADERAARFIYLNKTCFNGLYRENLRGDFNVPYGRHERSLVICDEDQIRDASDALAGADLLVCDFESAVGSASDQDVVYFDPPYTTAHSNNGFIEYNAKVFSWSDQERLAGVAMKLAKRGVHVVVSNADHTSIRRLYPKPFRARRIERWSTMAAKKKKRLPIHELVIENTS